VKGLRIIKITLFPNVIVTLKFYNTLRYLTDFIFLSLAEFRELLCDQAWLMTVCICQYISWAPCSVFMCLPSTFISVCHK